MQDILSRLLGPFDGGVTVSAEGAVRVPRPRALEGPAMDALVRAAVFGELATRDVARWLVWEIGQDVGVKPGSIHDLYIARGRGAVGGGERPGAGPPGPPPGLPPPASSAVTVTAGRDEPGMGCERGSNT